MDFLRIVAFGNSNKQDSQTPWANNTFVCQVNADMKLERFKQRELHGTVCLRDEYQLYSEKIRELERFWRLPIIRALLYRN
jgi:hypothetical protein